MGFQQKRGRLNLHRFAEAKSSNYNFLRLNKKQRERQQNSKRVNKYRRLLAKEGQQHRQEPGSPQGVQEPGAGDAEPDAGPAEQGDAGVSVESLDGGNGAEPRARALGSKHGPSLKKASHPEESSRDKATGASSGGVTPEREGKGSKGLIVDKRAGRPPGSGAGKGLDVEGSFHTEEEAAGSSKGGSAQGESKNVLTAGKRRGKPAGREVDPVEAEDEASRLRELEAKRRLREEAVKRRKEEAKSMRKTNAKGQPLMRHRIDRILNALTKPNR